MIPYGKQSINDTDIQAVLETLNSDFITTGPKVDEFEQAVAEFSGAKHAVAVSNGTAALHAAASCCDLQPNDEVIVTTMSFAASANCIVYAGAKPVFADVLPDSLLIDPEDTARKITPKTKAIIAVDFAGQPCDYDALSELARANNLLLIDDAAHAIGAEYKGRKIGSLADMTTFSFHPVKHITTCEGGMILTDRDDFNERLRHFRNHGITTDYRQRQERGAWFYEMTSLGYNYRLSDVQCALGLSQLERLPQWLEKRRDLAAIYDRAFQDMAHVTPLSCSAEVKNSYHLYVIRLTGKDRNKAFEALRSNGIGVNVHYIPIHLHPFYQNNFNTGRGLCPVAEEAFDSMLSLPLYPGLSKQEINFIIENVANL